MEIVEWMVEFEHNNGNLVTVRRNTGPEARAIYDSAILGPNERAIRLYRLIRISVAEKLMGSIEREP